MEKEPWDSSIASVNMAESFRIMLPCVVFILSIVRTPYRVS